MDHVAIGLTNLPNNQSVSSLVECELPRMAQSIGYRGGSFVGFGAVIGTQRSGTQGTTQVDFVDGTETAGWVECMNVAMLPTTTRITDG